MKTIDLASYVGKEILKEDAVFEEIHRIKAENDPLLFELNQMFRTKEDIRMKLEQITGKKIADSVDVSLPFYSDFGRNIQFGQEIFLNKNVTFVDLGGITIEDRVLIGPSARVLTVNHLADPKKRRGITIAPVRIKENAWIGANATILPGVTIGKNAIVAADSTVTKDVPENTIVVGSPARVVKEISEDHHHTDET